MTHVIKDRNSGEVVASGVLDETVVLLEGSWYFAPEAVNFDYLRVTERSYNCPYKGVCHWIDLNTPRTRAQNVAWVYDNPKPGYQAIRGYIGFGSEKTQGTLSVEIEDANAPALSRAAQR